MAHELGSDEAPEVREPYPWDKWTNGSWWSALSGEDYSCSTRSFQAYLYARARDHGLIVQTKVHPTTEGVMFKFAPAGADTTKKE